MSPVNIVFGHQAEKHPGFQKSWNWFFWLWICWSPLGQARNFSPPSHSLLKNNT